MRNLIDVIEAIKDVPYDDEYSYEFSHSAFNAVLTGYQNKVKIAAPETYPDMWNRVNDYMERVISNIEYNHPGLYETEWMINVIDIWSDIVDY